MQRKLLFLRGVVEEEWEERTCGTIKVPTWTCWTSDRYRSLAHHRKCGRCDQFGATCPRRVKANMEVQVSESRSNPSGIAYKALGCESDSVEDKSR